MHGAEWVVALGVVILATCLQGTAGLGFGVLAAPLLALMDPDLVPGTLLFLGVPTTIYLAYRERHALDYRGAQWALLGRIPGTVLGTIALAVLPRRGLVLSIAVCVLAAVLLSIAGWSLEPTPKVVVGAGVVSGVMGTATSVGGPPIALVYQRSDGGRLRGVLAVYFAVATTFSLAALVVSDQFHEADLRSGLALLPGVVVGCIAAAPLTAWLDRGGIRTLVLVLSTASALALLAAELF